jgi:hypothetical protein
MLIAISSLGDLDFDLDLDDELLFSLKLGSDSSLGDLDLVLVFE